MHLSSQQLLCLQESPDMRYMAARLMPTWRDTLEEQQQQHPALLSLTADQVAAIQQQRMPTDEPSFNQWAQSLCINPTRAVENIMAAMNHMSVTSLAIERSSTQGSKNAAVQAQPIEV